MEGEHHFERIVGGTEEEKYAAWNELQRMFESKNEQLQKYELEKTEEDLEIIEEATATVDTMVKKWGGDPKPIPIEKIHMLKLGSIREMTNGSLANGIHKVLSGNIGVEKERSPLGIVSTIGHELFHAKSFKAARVGESPEDVRLYRSGISMIDRKSGVEAGKEKEYFGILEEAIVAESTRQFFEKIKTNHLFKKEAEALNKIEDWVIHSLRKEKRFDEEFLGKLKGELKYVPEAQEIVKKVESYSEDEEKRAAYATGFFMRLAQEKKIGSWERYEERNKLYRLMDEIVAKSDGKFKDRDAVFDELATANYSGKYFKVARMFEEILGKGSFRRLAEEFSEKKEE